MELIVNEFNIQQIAESGQSFRWYPVKKGYVVVAFHQVIYLEQEAKKLTLEIIKGDDQIWHSYFDLDQDYNSIMSLLKGQFPYLDQAMVFGSGIRILKQEAYEMMMTFIISANNNIKRITQSILLLSERYGSLLCEYEGVKYYDFPTPEQLRNVSIEDYRACGVGYRDQYLYELIKTINQGHDISSYVSLTDSELKSALLRHKGIGEKVAHCIMLFGYYRINQFPVDTWIKKVLVEKLHANPKALREFIEHHFHEYGGVAQQYLFYYGRFEPKNIS
ncbi:MAG: 8-oxoguanine DNA glycosylase [Clostridia bacterium]|nr:8-oxoguanine DNA glycosylase [Clostridia bacterium]